MRRLFELDERVGAWRDATPFRRRVPAYVAVLAVTVVVAVAVVVAIMEPLSCAGRERAGTVVPVVALALAAVVVVAWLAVYEPARRRWWEGRA